MQNPLAGEFFGTFVMMVLGDGVVAACLLKRTKAEGAGWLAITAGWGFAVLCGIFTANLFGSPAAYLNPAITLAYAIKNGDFSNVLPFLIAQTGGAFFASVIVWLFYFPHWKETEDPAVKLAVFCTGPAIRSYGFNLLSEIIATFMLVIVVGAIGSKTVLATGPRARSGSLPCRMSGAFDRIIARRDDGLCHQSGPGPGATNRTCAVAHCGQGQLRLGIFLGPDSGAFHWGKSCRLCTALPQSLKFVETHVSYIQCRNTSEAFFVTMNGFADLGSELNFPKVLGF